MHLMIEGHPKVFSEGSLRVELPGYFRFLPEDELQEARLAENRDGLILAAAWHPDRENFILLTGAGEVFELNVWQHGLPPVPVEPIDFGQTLRFDVAVGSFEVPNTWAIRNANSLVFLGAMVKPEGASVVYVPA